MIPAFLGPPGQHKHRRERKPWRFHLSISNSVSCVVFLLHICATQPALAH